MSDRKVILLVEDNNNDELLAIRALKKCAVPTEISVARDGVDALEYLFGEDESGTRNKIPELILLDLNIPKLNGLEVLKKLKSDETTSHVPVVIMTSSTESSDINTSYALGANSYLRKPVDFKEFSFLIDQLTTYWLVLNQASQTQTTAH